MISKEGRRDSKKRKKEESERIEQRKEEKEGKRRFGGIGEKEGKSGGERKRGENRKEAT